MTVFLQPGRRALLKTTAAAAAAAAAAASAAAAAALTSVGRASVTIGDRPGQYCSRPRRLQVLKLEMSSGTTNAAMPLQVNSLHLNSDKTKITLSI